eukprot:c54708_g1_i1.p2 GENE.c54708_g1_i1~~c54708_g1_i1.p2  ORF type:complete len:275 (-),score=41.06 c54708_g1_i1:109-933(-)
MQFLSSACARIGEALSFRTPAFVRAGAIRVLQVGPIPEHMAFIMDGNRRFARQHDLPTRAGHSEGYTKLTETLRWCSELGVRTVSVYAFSIDNFQRAADEVDGLLDLARRKFSELLAERDFIDEHRVRIRVLGNLALLPADLRAIMAEVEAVSAHHTRMTLNVCFAYTARDEITAAISTVAAQVAAGSLSPSDIDESAVDAAMYFGDSPPPDVVVRTSGEIRLSNFMLWQSSFAYLSFLSVLWPQLSFWHLAGVVLAYQRQAASQAAWRAWAAA